MECAGKALRWLFVTFLSSSTGHVPQCLFLVSVLSAAFGLLSAFAPNFAWMIFLRCMLGIAAGGSAQGYVCMCVCASMIPCVYVRMCCCVRVRVCLCVLLCMCAPVV